MLSSTQSMPQITQCMEQRSDACIQLTTPACLLRAAPQAGELPMLADPSRKDDESTGPRRHIKFNEADLEELLNKEGGSGMALRFSLRLWP